MASWTRFEVVDEHIMKTKERRQEGKNWICDLRWYQRSAGDILSVLSQECNHTRNSLQVSSMNNCLTLMLSRVLQEILLGISEEHLTCSKQ